MLISFRACKNIGHKQFFQATKGSIKEKNK